MTDKVTYNLTGEGMMVERESSIVPTRGDRVIIPIVEGGTVFEVEDVEYHILENSTVASVEVSYVD